MLFILSTPNFSVYVSVEDMYILPIHFQIKLEIISDEHFDNQNQKNPLLTVAIFTCSQTIKFFLEVIA